MPETLLTGQYVPILANRRAGRGDAVALLQGLADELTTIGFVPTIHFEIDEFERSIRSTPPQTIRCAVAAGGDGTVERVANLVDEIPITVFPMGTENLLAKHFGIAQDPHLVAEIIRNGRTKPIDIGTAGDKRFLIMLSCGFDAEVVRRLHETRHGNINHWSYAKPILDALRNYDYPNLRVSTWRDDENAPETIDAYWVFVFNLPTYAAGLGICPHAVADDGMLDIVTFSGKSLWHGLYHLSAVLLRQHENLTEFHTCRAKRVLIESDREVPYQIDGDPGGALPVEVSILYQKLHLMIP